MAGLVGELRDEEEVERVRSTLEAVSWSPDWEIRLMSLAPSSR